MAYHFVQSTEKQQSNIFYLKTDNKQ